MKKSFARIQFFAVMLVFTQTIRSEDGKRPEEMVIKSPEFQKLQDLLEGQNKRAYKKPLQSKGYLNSMKDSLMAPLHWAASTLPNRETIENLARKPTTWLTVGAGIYGTHKLGQFIDSPKYAMLAVGGTFAALNVATFVNWLSLRSRYLKLAKEQTDSSDPYVRNVWLNPLHGKIKIPLGDEQGEVKKNDKGQSVTIKYEADEEYFRDGKDIMTTFELAGKTENAEALQKFMKKSFLNQLSVSTEMEGIAKLEKALKQIREEDLPWYRKFTNIQYELAIGAGVKTPDQLLTSDILIDNSMADRDGKNAVGQPSITRSPLQTIFKLANEKVLYSIRFDVTDAWQIPYLYPYTWNYRMASSCVWLGLLHYSLLKAIRKVLETPIISDNENRQNYDLVVRFPQQVLQDAIK